MADDAITVLDTLGWERAHLFGHSMGGLVAQRIAIRHPQRVHTHHLLGRPQRREGTERPALPAPGTPGPLRQVASPPDPAGQHGPGPGRRPHPGRTRPAHRRVRRA
ncbi:alpha/beta fold hydrolase [Streptomyces nogalater]